MVNKVLKGVVKNFLESLLSEKGFKSQTRQLVFERELDGVIQGIEIQKGRGIHSSEFTVNIFWKYIHNQKEHDWLLSYRQRIGRFVSEMDIWFSTNPESIEKELSYIKKILISEVFPFLDLFKSVQSIIAEFESGKLDPRVAFGTDINWQNYNIAFCYLYLDNKLKAKEYFRRVAEFEIDLSQETEDYSKLFEISKTMSRRLSDQE